MKLVGFGAGQKNSSSRKRFSQESYLALLTRWGLFVESHWRM